MTIAVLRPHSWDFPLFLHVLGATLLFGGMVTVTVVGIAAWRRRDVAGLLTGVAFRTFLIVVIPAFVLMRVAAEWILSREKDQIPGLDNKTWVGIGFIVSDAGVLVLIALGILGYFSKRRGGGFTTAAFAVLSVVYLCALAVAWFAMSGKPGA